MKWNPLTVPGIALIIAIGIMCVPVSALSLRLDDAKFTEAGQTVAVDLIADEFPQGLSGFNISITVKNPAVGLISAVIFPDWAVPRSSSAVPAASVWAKAVDMKNAVQPGDRNVVLAHIMVKSNAPGTTGFTIKPVAIDDEKGNAIAAAQFIPAVSGASASGLPGPTATTTEIEPERTTTIEQTPVVINQAVTIGFPEGQTPVPTNVPANSEPQTGGTPQVIYVNGTPEVVYVYVTQKSPVLPFLPVIAIGIVGMGLALFRKKER